MNNNTQICSSLEELIAYKNNRLPNIQKNKVKEHFSECQLCSNAYDGLCAESNTQETINTVKMLKNKILLQSKISKSNKKRHILLAALTFGLLTVLFFVSTQPTNQIIIEKYFEPYPNTFPITRGIGEVSNFEKAMIEYEQKNYFESIKLLNIIIATDPKNMYARLYDGISNLAINNPDEAISQLLAIEPSPNSDLKSEPKWFLALAYIQKGELELAIKTLDGLQGQQGKYYDKSKLLLKELKAFD